MGSLGLDKRKRDAFRAAPHVQCPQRLSSGGRAPGSRVTPIAQEFAGMAPQYTPSPEPSEAQAAREGGEAGAELTPFARQAPCRRAFLSAEFRHRA